MVEPMARGQAERLMPICAAMLTQAGIGWRDLGAIGVGTGPGNFTGTRIGVAAARGIALACEIPAIGVTTFEALADDEAGAVLVTLDARRGAIFAQSFRAGLASAPPRLATFADLAHPGPGTRCLGFAAGEIAARFGLEAGSEATRPDPAALARIARSRRADAQPAPAPLYLRAADAVPAPRRALLPADDA